VHKEEAEARAEQEQELERMKQQPHQGQLTEEEAVAEVLTMETPQEQQVVQV